MPKLKIDKHVVYTLMMNNLDWFKSKNGEDRFITRTELEDHINRYLEKDYDVDLLDRHYDPPYISLGASTLTAMVRDEVIERRYNDFLKCYTYRPYCDEIVKGYCSKYYYFPQMFS